MNAQKYAGAVGPFVLVLLTGTYGYWAVQRELISSRPSGPGQYDVPDPVPPVGLRSLHSRLWQDPLSTAYEHWKTLREKEWAENLTSVSDSEELTNTVRNAATSSSGRKSAAGADNTKPTRKEEHTREEKRFAERTTHMRKFFRSLVDKRKTVCMPVLLPGGPYAEEKEKRMRIRYAVVTALAESGYYLKYPTRMSYVVVRIHVRVLRGWQEREIVVPVKLYRLDDSSQQVLVLWINESELELRPLLAMHRILNAMFSEVTKPRNLEVSIIGPASSSTLSNMGQEIGHINDAFFPMVIHEANKFRSETCDDAHYKIDALYREIQQRAKEIKDAACNSEMPRVEEIRRSAAIIGNTRAHGRIRKLAEEIKKTIDEEMDTGAATILAPAEKIIELAEKIIKLVEEIEQESDALVDAAHSTIQEAAGRIANEIDDKPHAQARKSIETETNILLQEVNVIWREVKCIDQMVKHLNGGQAEERTTWTRNIKRAANQLELAEASAVIQRQVNNITEKAYSVFQSEVGKIIKQTAKELNRDADAKQTLADTFNLKADKIARAKTHADIRRAVVHIKEQLDGTKFALGVQKKHTRDVISILDAAVQVAGAVGKVALARAYPVFQTEVENAKADNSAEYIDEKFKMLAAAVEIFDAVVTTTEAADRLISEALTSRQSQGAGGQEKIAASVAGADETKNVAGPDAERITEASKVIARQAENIKRIAAKSKMDGASEIRKAADVLRKSAQSVQRIAEDIRDIAEDIRDVERGDSRRPIDYRNGGVKSEPVTVIQRAAAIIKQQAEAVEYGEPDLALVAQQVDRIRVAQAYELTKQAADRIFQNAKTMSAKADETETDKAVQCIKEDSEKIIAEAYEIIKQLGGNIDLNKDSNYWYATAYSEKHAERIQGFMPLLSSLEHGGAAAELFSPRATMDNIEFSKNNFVNLRPVIGTDRQLAEVLHDELQRRGAVPGQIVLITEHDTAYGRAFPKTFESVFPIHFETQIKPILDKKCLKCHDWNNDAGKAAWRFDRRSRTRVNKPSNSVDCGLVRKLNWRKGDANHTVEASELDLLKRWVDQRAEGKRPEDPSSFVSFKILRGIDGRLPGDNSKSPARAQVSSRKSSPTDLPEIVERPPEGRTQFDYLKRLRHRIQQLNDVTAIGVVGSDVYDKLLVLRALKPHFPDCVFFTTDLDAIYSHPAELRHARNLLIASHFDLRLHRRLQESTAPFRDSYQTSAFLATRLAIHHDDPDYWFFKEKPAGHDPNYWFLGKKQVDNDPDSRDSNENWAAVIDHWFGNRENKDKYEFAPVLHVVGRTSTQPLILFDKETIEGKLHPKLSHAAGTWHYLFVAGCTLAAVGLVWVLVHRDGFRESQLLNDDGNTPWIRKLLRRVRRRIVRARRFLESTGRRQGLVQSLDKRLESLRRLLVRRGKLLESHINLGLIFLIGIGCGLVLVFGFRGYEGSERSDFLGGYSTWPRKILYSVTGIFAVLSVAYVLDQFRIRLKELPSEHGTVGKLASNCFQQAHILKIALLALVIAYTGGAFVYEFKFLGFLIPAFATLLGLAVAWWYYAERPPQNEPTSRGSDTAEEPAPGNLILGLDLTPAIGYGLISIIGVTALAFVGERLFEESHIGWHPTTTSRRWFSQFGDWLATVYAFGAIALLLSTMIYFHLWCREFARKAEELFNESYGQAGNGGHDGTADDPEDAPDIAAMEKEWRSETVKDSSYWKNKHDRLWTIGRLSAALGRQGPVLMGLLFVLLIAYHPWLSPLPMPLSLVVMTTVSLILFIMSALAFRWHFHKERDETLSDLRQQLEEVCESIEARAASEEEGQSTRQETFRKQLVEFRDLVDANDGWAPEEVTNAVLKLNEKVEEHEMEAARQQKQQQKQLKTSLTTHLEKIGAISEGVFRSWNQSPIGWILGGGTALALVDFWVRWWTIGL